MSVFEKVPSPTASPCRAATYASAAAHVTAYSSLLSSGASPGVSLNGVPLPLNVPDFFFKFTLTNANAGPFTDTLGTVGSSGGAAASVTVPAGLNASLVGFRLDFAYLVFDVPGLGNAVFGSNPVPLEFVP